MLLGSHVCLLICSTLVILVTSIPHSVSSAGHWANHFLVLDCLNFYFTRGKGVHQNASFSFSAIHLDSHTVLMQKATVWSGAAEPIICASWYKRNWRRISLYSTSNMINKVKREILLNQPWRLYRQVTTIYVPLKPMWILTNFNQWIQPWVGLAKVS
jgi:hypothetical protein